MVIYDSDENLLRTFHTEVTITDPVTHYSCGNGRHTTYLVVLESNDVCFSQERSVVRRRFSEFVFLRRLLKQTQPTVNPPSLHSNSLFHDRFCCEFIMQRSQQLETFMKQIISEPLYLSNKALHLFLQTNLPMREIEAQITGISPIIPLEESDSHSFASDSSVSTGSSGGSECHTCDSLHKSISHPDLRTVCLLSTNHEAFVTSVPFPCSSDTHMMSKKLLTSKELCHQEECKATSSDCSPLTGVLKLTCDSGASSNTASSELRKTVSFSDVISINVISDVIS